ncbi:MULTISPECIES: hypothetical protein [unclassified Lysinibacillus]|uniref:hypothetical protein n=1 Tax=unclassified Lysinibacillus TaxID=2636778 RepID=UPI0037F4FA37
MKKMLDDAVGKVIPISKKEVDEFKLLVAEAAFLTENRDNLNFSSNFPPELAGILGGLGTGTVGVGVVVAYFAGMSGAEIMAALASFGVAGAVGGIASIAAVVAAPVVLVSGGLYHVANQNKLGRELEKLIKQSYEFEKQLKDDERGNVKGLLKTIQEYREKFKKKHSDLRKIKD